jgi:hypothetical protein
MGIKMPNKLITPISLIGSIAALATFAGILFGIDARYQSAEAADIKAAEQLKIQQKDRTETDIDLIELEIEFLKWKKQDALEHDDQKEVDDLDKEIDYLTKKKLVLEEYKLQLETK